MNTKTEPEEKEKSNEEKRKEALELIQKALWLFNELEKEGDIEKLNEFNERFNECFYFLKK